jgi:hypothetical protein
MTTVVVTGDLATTTCLLLAVTWPGADRADPLNGGGDRLIVECDPSGGSLIAWLGLDPALTLTTAVTGHHDDSGYPGACAQPIGSGLAAIISPIRSVEASAAQARAQQSLLVEICSTAGLTTFIDTGQPSLSHSWVPAWADLVVIVHHQRSGPAAAAAVRVERLAERLESLETAGHRPALMIVGSVPFDPREIIGHLGHDRLATVVTVPDDRFAAEVLAGRVGCSERRFGRLRLVRAGRAAALALSTHLGSSARTSGTDQAGSRSHRVGIDPVGVAERGGDGSRI